MAQCFGIGKWENVGGVLNPQNPQILLLNTLGRADQVLGQG